ncbi:protein-L-isoaspartate O-methyltransferase family protein [Litoreibacter roseus]|uniref:Protein-L-isoaspartate O-methyltransferase n=1 Tax=Litoreibacter roseus TaxID=2601869 RepID=A0A6N6JDZ1_9RHOB|nr:protein-L-isoaspartate O-methyltransferase [Litoreibacter roseus]GFE63422.1 protein-L-isoaspartate O-methyltransferase [Litoreibacter roseus]
MMDFAASRTMMVDTQVRPSDVTKFPIIDAMLTVRREAFVPNAKRAVAYAGEDVDLGRGRFLLEPRTLAKMLDALDIQQDDLVLDLGCGLGYSSAVLARLAQAVVAVEEDETLLSEAETALSEQGADNVAVMAGTLAEGAAQHGPYDVITIQGGVEQVPDALIDQLKDGGRIGALFVDGALGECRIGYKVDGWVTWRMAFNAGAPILAGFEKKPSFSL